jgi:hypothetical protein
LIDLPDTFDVAYVVRFLAKQKARIVSLDFTVSLFLFLGGLESSNLRISEHLASFSCVLFKALETLAFA